MDTARSLSTVFPSDFMGMYTFVTFIDSVSGYKLLRASARRVAQKWWPMQIRLVHVARAGGVDNQIIASDRRNWWFITLISALMAFSRPLWVFMV
jgi:hypothetical protein